MNLDPPKFFIGLMKFFSILLPGALLTYLLMGEVGPVLLGDRYGKLAGAEAWAAFLFVGYLVCSRIVLLGGSKREANELTTGPLGPRCCDHATPGRSSKRRGTCNNLAQMGKYLLTRVINYAVTVKCSKNK
jgi:hypothetical protein